MSLHHGRYGGSSEDEHVMDDGYDVDGNEADTHSAAAVINATIVGSEEDEDNLVSGFAAQIAPAHTSIVPPTFVLPDDQGAADTQFNLGVRYNNGEGVRQDYAEAVKWYRLAAEQGNADAQYNLGVLYDNGERVRQDHTEAVKWYRLAADQSSREL